MFRKMAYNHIKKNRLVTILLTLFITAASFLVSLAAIMTEDLLKSADAFVEQTKLPHFLQMHEGELDRVRLNEFADSQEDVLSLQISDFLNIDNSQLVMAEHSMTDQVGDNGFCVQNKEFDYLIDSNQNVIQPDEGEVYVPICYWKAFDLKSGDQMMVGKKQLTIAGFLRDGQMNSSFASSKRFLISEKDYEEIKPHGEEEYLIEFRLKDEKAVSAFSEAYTAAELPCNGPAITYPFFRLIQTLSDGMMIAIIVLISILIVLVAFLCIRFTLLTKLEEDFREIGIMKAIGVSAKDIRMFYLGTYIAIAVAGCSCGYICSLLVKNIFLSNIHLYMGKGSNGVLGCVLGLLGCVLIYLWIVSYVSRILRRIRQISSALALRDIGGEEKGGKNQWSLAKNTWINTNLFLGIKDVIIRKKIYITMLLLLIVTVFIMIVPQNLYQTMSSSRFITYMGVGQCQMRIDLQRQDDYEKTSMEIEKLL
ncbi:MAG: ABC transporter permease, partial [Clostridia bacterium]|nr:ABC transporter permease [Clostridia bacterium]